MHPNAERYLKPSDEMLRLFRQYPQAVERTQELADVCRFSLDELKYEYSEEITSEGRTPGTIFIALVNLRCNVLF